MDIVGATSVDGAPSPDSQHSQLSMDDLVDDTLAGNDTQRVEAKLQWNLQQQQEHYERQRKLFEALGRDSVLGKVATSPLAEDDDEESDRPTRGAKFRRDVDPKAVESDRHDSLDEDDAIAIERLQRKAKSIANYHSRIAHSGGLPFTRGALATKASGGRTRGGSLHRFDESTTHYESSNEALRKQLELLRRLQLENNRFRHENRSLREQNDVFEEQTTLHTREIKRLQDEVQELSLRVQHDQLELATAAQNLRKMKQLQKQVETLQNERDQLQVSLQEAKDQDSQFRLHSQSEIETVVQETKHLKRSLKQSRQLIAQLQDQIEELKHALATSEQNAGELKRQLLTAEREKSEMATRISEKTTHIESIESSATQCVERMEAGMEALQKAHTGEREKRKKLEKLRDTLENDVTTLENTRSKLEDRVQELDTYNTQLQQRLQDCKLEKKQEKKFYDDKLTEWHERHKSDTKTIAALRDECATYEQQLEITRTSIVEIRKEVAAESNALRKGVEALRNYIEDAQRTPLASVALDDTSNAGDTSGGSSSQTNVQLSRSRREELWVQLPELQFLQGAMGGLRNETMNFVSDFQRARHQVRQSAAALASAQERIVELEHLRSNDAITRKDLEDQRLLAEQAREITLREKMDVLAWSQQACEKNERLETTLAQCAASVQSVVKKTRHTATTVEAAVAARSGLGGTTDEDSNRSTSLLTSKADEDSENHAIRLLSVLEREMQHFITHVETLVDNYKTSTQEGDNRQVRLERVQKELEAQRQDHVAVVAEIEALHARTMTEKQKLFNDSLQAIETERDTLQKELANEREAVATMQSMNETLEKRLDELEQDVPVLATIVQLFALVVPPLVLQVSDLLTQKRVLMHENAEYAMAHEQVECIGQVLRELVPSGSGGSLENTIEMERRQRRRRFRRVVIAVFALNRFQRGGFAGSAAGTGESVYGVCSSLKPIKKKKAASMTSSFNSGSSSSCLPPPTVIKVLPFKPLLARLNVRSVIDRLRSMELITKLEEVIEVSSSEGNGTSSFGGLLMRVLAALDPANKEVLAADTAGIFHCRPLLERRKASRWQDASTNGDHEDMRLSTVDLIRKRILALGKRLEDLHYQRNSLQKENYEFQYQLDQQAVQLREMETLRNKNDELQQELEQLHEQQRGEAAAKETELAENVRTLKERQQHIATQQDEITRLEKEIVVFETKIAELELEKTDLHHTLLVAKSALAAKEEKLQKSQISMDKQAEELKALMQTAKRAHEQHQRVAWQLEQELVEKANLQAMMEHLRKQKETLEREVASAKVRVLDESLSTDAEGDVEAQKQPPFATKKPQLAGSASSTGSYERQLQDLTERIANMRTTSIPLHHEDNDDDEHEHFDNEAVAKAETEMKRPLRTRVNDLSDTFLSEWKRLDISGVFEEDDTSKTERRMPDRVNHDSSTSPTRRCDDEIDKVNSAVHDYMDRIDEKLQQLYGIPRSSARQRPPSTATVIHGTSSICDM